MKLYPYNPGSASAKALAQALGIKRVKHQGVPVFVDILINWGSTNITREFKLRRGKDSYVVYNDDQFVKKAANKLETFKALKDAGVSIPEFTESFAEANDWLHECDVVARTVLNGHSGQGLEIVNIDSDAMVIAPLYTKYIKKKEEYRIHVFGDEVFHVQRKARKKDVPDDQVNWKVRNLAGGFIFAHQGVEVSDVAKTEAINAVKALGLDFGAVDIILGTDKKWYVLEVNTACGLEGTTLEKYVEQFRKIQNG